MSQPGVDLVPEPSRDDHVRGSLEFPVVNTEFGDFECPYCGDAATALDAVLAKYDGRVALVFRHYPLSMHPHARAAAEASEAAAAAGKFWQMHDLLFRNQRALTIPDLRTYADAIGVDADAVEGAVARNTFRNRIERDVKSGNESGIEGTPSIFINGYAFDGEPSVEGLSEAVEQALAAASAASR